MLFNSLHFLFFFIVVAITYYSLPHKFRWILLLISSCYFYIINIPIYFLILLCIVLVSYSAGIYIEDSQKAKRKLLLVFSLIIAISVLVFFKYYNFINDNISALLHVFGLKNNIPHLSLILPLGLSFYTFISMSYMIEVYRGTQKAERNLGIYATFNMFFPIILAGPIERSKNLLHQFYEEHDFDYKNVTNGLKLIAWGLFQKVVIADRLAIFVDKIYSNPHEYQGFSFILATIFFSFQIFCDFSGYTDMAIGVAQVLGFKLMKNFNRPYFASTIQEFWSRWHISLSSWLRDYLFLPLSYFFSDKLSKEKYLFIKSDKWIYILSTLITFLICGLWHGAQWTYVIWGGLHGFYLIFAIFTKKRRIKLSKQVGLNKLPRLNSVLQILTTFFLTTFAWIFFKARTFSEAIYVIKYSMIGSINTFQEFLHHKKIRLHLGLRYRDIFIAIILIILLVMIHIMQNKYRIREWISTKPIYIRWCIYYAFVLIILFFGVFEDREFIYFQF